MVVLRRGRRETEAELTMGRAPGDLWRRLEGPGGGGIPPPSFGGGGEELGAMELEPLEILVAADAPARGRRGGVGRRGWRGE